MGRPIQKKWFGDPDSAGYQLTITAKLPGEAVGEGYIVAQKGTNKYKVNVGGAIGDVYLRNTLVSGELLDGEGFMTATPFGGSSLPVYKLTQYRVSLHDGAGGFDTYTWSQAAAAVESEADVLDEAVPEINLLSNDQFLVDTNGDGVPDGWEASNPAVVTLAVTSLGTGNTLILNAG